MLIKFVFILQFAIMSSTRQDQRGHIQTRRILSSITKRDRREYILQWHSTHDDSQYCSRECIKFHLAEDGVDHQYNEAEIDGLLYDIKSRIARNWVARTHPAYVAVIPKQPKYAVFPNRISANGWLEMMDIPKNLKKKCILFFESMDDADKYLVKRNKLLKCGNKRCRVPKDVACNMKECPPAAPWYQS